MHKKRNSLIAILVILLIVFNVVVFAINLPRTATFWVADLFALIAIIAQAGTHYLAYGNAETLLSKVYGFPIVQVGYYYLGTQLVASLIFILLAWVIPVWVVITVSVVLCGIAAVGVIANDTARNTIEEMDEYHDLQTSFMTSLFTRVKTLADTTKDKSLKEKIRAFAQEIEYSDFVSSPDLGHVENNLWNAVAELEASIHSNNLVEADKRLIESQDLLCQRNNLCHKYKKKSMNHGTPSGD